MTKRRLIGVQGAYYVATGLWPLFSMRSFERVTGPKVDKWLVQMVGSLAVAIGTALLVATREELEVPTIALSTMSALAFGSISTVHAMRRRISAIYFGDAVVEALIVGALVVTRA
jgi:hypothetical protein